MGNSDSSIPDSKRTGTEVLLNVYDQGKGGAQFPGFGVYHSGVQLFGREYSFAGGPEAPPGQSGVGEQTPRESPAGSQWVFKETVKLGNTDLTDAQVKAALDSLRKEFAAQSYHVMQRNCNHFAEVLCTRLHVKFPKWVNRAAKLGNTFSGTENPVDAEKRIAAREQAVNTKAAEEARKKKELLDAKQGKLKEEPTKEAAGVIEIQINCPSGIKTKRRFRPTDTIQDVMSFAAAFDLTLPRKFNMRRNHPPPRMVYKKHKQTLKEAGFSRRENLFVDTTS